MPELKFNSGRHRSEDHRFSEIVCRNLLTHKAPVLESLRLVARDETEALDVYGLGLHFHTVCVNWHLIDLYNEKESDARFPSVEDDHHYRD